jgi:hypothetical protein
MRLVTVTPRMASIVVRMACSRANQEERLWAYVLTSAIRDCRKHASESECRAFFKCQWFNEVCEMAGVDPLYARQVIGMIGRKMPVDVARLEKDDGHW